MRVTDARFLTSAAGPDEGAGWPEEGPPEVAFIGRSNVGKSTLLAALLGRRGLVRVSGDPGRTRLVNFFDADVIDDAGARHALRLVDLPGFGYARVSKQERKTFRPIVQTFLEERRALRAAVLLVDLRRGAELDETELARFLREHVRRLIVVGTKADKLSKHERKPAAAAIGKALGAPVLVVSGESGEGIPDLWRRLLQATTPSVAPSGEP
jgi:GTP-binding protein